jgi:hypothetical protein
MENSKNSKKQEYKMPIAPRKASKESSPQKRMIIDTHDMKQMQTEDEETSQHRGIQHYNNVDELYKEFGENSDYEMVDLQEIQNMIGGELNNQLFLPSEEEITELEKTFSENSRDLMTVYKLIYCYKAINEKYKLKNMREHAITHFPLSEEMWMDWIKEEIALIKCEEIEKKYAMIDKMFKKALKDFPCIIIIKIRL